MQGETNSTDPAGAGVVGKNNGGGPGLKAIVNAGAPPLAVNSSVKVANLNADLLDGLDSLALQKRVTDTCAAGSAVKSVNADGAVACEQVSGGRRVERDRQLRHHAGHQLPRYDRQPGARAQGERVNARCASSRTRAVSPVLRPVPTSSAASPGQFRSASATSVPSLQAVAHSPCPTDAGTSYDFIGAGFDNAVGAAGGNKASAVVAGTHNAAPVGWGFIGAGDSNSVIADYDFVGAGIDNHAGITGGGGASAIVAGTNNIASGGSAFIGAGGVNQATANYAFVGAGQFNTASGLWASAAGGSENTAGGDNSSVAGGANNTASGHFSSIAGGASNTAGGDWSAVAGGFGNIASGNASFAAGNRAKATHDGSFVWGDSSAVDIGSNGTNTFTVRSTGGARFVSGIDASGSAFRTQEFCWRRTAAPGRRSQTGTPKSTLRRSTSRRCLVGLLASRSSAGTTRRRSQWMVHIGPTAQDFSRAFGLGEDNRHITTVDADGVALAAIQGLYRQNQRLDRDNHALDRKTWSSSGGTSDYRHGSNGSRRR